MDFIIGTKDKTEFIVFRFGKYEEGREHLPDPPILSKTSWENAMVFYDHSLKNTLREFRNQYPEKNLVPYEIAGYIVQIKE